MLIGLDVEVPAFRSTYRVEGEANSPLSNIDRTHAPQEETMANQIFVNLPVKDLNRSVEFFTKLGYTFNPQFTDENATCMIIGEKIFAMLLVEDYFRTFTDRDLIDAHKSVESIVALAVDSREAVDAQIAAARDAGATIPRDPQDYGFMYQHAFQDLDGHMWEVFHMDMSAVPDGSGEAVAPA